MKFRLGSKKTLEERPTFPGRVARGEAGQVRINDWQVLKMKIRPPAA
jgi:hypothetical protein